MGKTQTRPRLNRPAAGAARPAEAPPAASWRVALAIVAGAGVLRLIIAALTPLFPDETYYWDWSRHLALGYFDHPPAIAWLIRGGTLLFGDTALGVRLGPNLAGVLAGYFVLLSARRLGGDTAAVYAALIFALMPLSAAGLILATPDAPLFGAAAACIYALLRAVNAAERRISTIWWGVAGAALGVATASKYTAVLLPLAVLVALLSRRDLRTQLRMPGPYIAGAVALAVFVPVLVWNADHEWISFAFQLRHGLGGVGGSIVSRELELLGGQLGLVTPILFTMMVVAAARTRSDTRVLLATVAAIVFVFFIYSATRRRVEANWPALAYIPGIILLATHAGGQVWRRWLRGGLILAAAATTVTYVNTFTPILPVPARRDPVARSAGWGELADAVDRVHAARRSLSSRRTWVAADRYQDASELAFHLPAVPEVFSLNLTTRPNQYDLWPKFTDRAQPRDALILVVDEVPGVHPTLALLQPHFGSVRQDSMVTLARKGDPVRYLRIWLLDEWHGSWPQASLRSRP